MSLAGRNTVNRQLVALVLLRWRMIRSGPLRLGIALLTLAPVAVVILAMASLAQLPDDQAVNLALATPTLYLGFVLLAILAPLISGGGYELYPPDQLVAYPVKPPTVFRSTLVLAPANLAWILNVIALFAVTSLAAGPIDVGPTAMALTVVGAFVMLATVLGHTIGWLVVGIRQTRAGRWVTNVVGVGTVIVAVAVIWADLVIDVLDSSPTRHVLASAYDGYNGRHLSWLMALVIMSVLTWLGVQFGGYITAWALRRPGDHADRTASRSLSRRSTPTHPLLALLQMDCSSVWRSVPLRRGVLVLILVPGAVAAMAGMSWQSLVLVPGLIAAGSGLLFGINSFALDSSGAVWLATLPRWWHFAFLSKSLVFSVITLAAVTSVLVGGSLRAPSPEWLADITAAAASGLACSAIVVAAGMRSSLKHPYRAELRGPRDTPASPGVMAAQSVRFAVLTTFVGLYCGALSLSHVWWLPIVGVVPVLVGCVLHLLATQQAWTHPHVRANVLMTVSAG